MVKVRENEHKILLTLKRFDGKALLDQVVKETSLSDATVMKAALTLEKKKLVKVSERKKTIIELNKEGELHAERGLPERLLVNALAKLGGEASISKVVQKAELEEKFVPIALGWLRKKGWVLFDAKTGKLKLLGKVEGVDEKLLSLLKEKGKLVVEDLSSKMRSAAKILKRRKLLRVSEKKEKIIEITDEGWKALKKGVKVEVEITQLTPELIITGKWRKVKLTKFDVTAPSPTVYPAKVHPVQQIIRRIKEIFAEMGFTEIRGPIVETAFWNFDALFQPQDHPAREMHDTFYLEYPKAGKLPEKSIVEKVAKTHEDGWKTGSKGWKYRWSPEEAKRLILRTHTTATTIRYLAEHHEPPIKVFSVDRVYRNEKMNYKSLFEFHQIEGIIMDKHVTFRDLIGTLKEFYSKLGLKRVKFWPSYFPYTEPSAQSTVYIPEHKKWFELCGMGMFRPEVLKPLGIKYPVLAWGGGLERLIMLKLGLDDIRLLYKNDLGWIRRTVICQ